MRYIGSISRGAEKPWGRGGVAGSVGRFRLAEIVKKSLKPVKMLALVWRLKYDRNMRHRN